MADFQQDVEAGQRFSFGENWKRFLSVLNEERIAEAETSLQKMTGKDSLKGLRFLDIGCGSGLFSLAARRLGAYVHSFDYDPQAVACTLELRRRYFAQDTDWKVETGDVLNQDYLKSLGQFDIVYSWGVLHHTGAMWKALQTVDLAVSPQGMLLIAIYNDQGGQSKRWRYIKKTYNHLPAALKQPFALLVMVPRELKDAILTSLAHGPAVYIKSWTEYAKNRGMSRWHDMIDWVGGYPFEVARPEEIFSFYRNLGYTLIGLRTVGGSLGCNEYAFEKSARA